MDSRFGQAAAAPIFRKSKRGKHKVKLDERFSGILSDQRFQINPGDVDKYGRKSGQERSHVMAELESLYEIDTENSEEMLGEEKEKRCVLHQNSLRHTPVQNSERVLTKKLESKDIEGRLEYLNKLSRGEVSNVVDSDSSNGDSEAEYQDSLSDELSVEQLEDGAETNRIAIQNCHWDRIRADDIL